MPLFNLRVKAKLEGIQSIAINDDFAVRVTFQCASCNELSEKESVFQWESEVEVPDSRSTAHLVQHCKFCRNLWTVIINSPRSAFIITEDNAEKGAITLELEARGCTPVTFSPGDGWTITSTSGYKWENVDLSAAAKNMKNMEEWTEYDENGDFPVLVSEIAGEFEAKKK